MAFFEDTVNWSGDYGKWLILGKGDNQLIMALSTFLALKLAFESVVMRK